MPKLIVHSFDKSTNEQVRLSIGEFKDKRYFDLRIYFKEEGSADFYPSRKGITLSFDFLPEIIKGIQKIGDATLNQKLSM